MTAEFVVRFGRSEVQDMTDCIRIHAHIRQVPARDYWSQMTLDRQNCQILAISHFCLARVADLSEAMDTTTSISISMLALPQV